MSDLLKKVAKGDPVLASQFNLIVDLANALIQSGLCYIDSQGVSIRAGAIRASAGGTQIRPGIVVSVPAAAATTLQIQPMKAVPGSLRFDWVVDGGVITLPIWGSQTGADFIPIVSSPGATQKYMIDLITVNGQEFARQYLWVNTGTPGASPNGDCA